jgi:cytochrome c biogenesis protein CcdA
MLRGMTAARTGEAGRGGALDARTATAWGAVLLALAAAIGGALVTGPAGGDLTLAVATLSSRATAALQGVGGTFPHGYAVAAGMAAAVNPCGFALLPAYLGLYLGASGDAGTRSIPRALVVGASMTLGFVALFGIAGLLLAALVDVLPWLSLFIGLLLVLAGGRMLAGGSFDASGAERLGARLGVLAGRSGLVGYAAYGVAFALSSLGCTLPLFLTVVGTALTAGGFGAAAAQFLLYGLGMGLVVTGATVLVALFGRAVVAPSGWAGRYLGPASAVLLLVTGAYVVYYWLTVGGLLG